MDDDTQGKNEEEEEEEIDEEAAAAAAAAIARETSKSRKAPRINPWLFLPLTLKYQLKSSSKLFQSLSPYASTISSIDFLKSQNGSSESIDTTVVPSFNGGGTAAFFFSSFKIDLDFPVGSKRSLSVDLRPRIILSIGSPPEHSDAVERLPEDSEESVKKESEDSVAAAAAAAVVVRKERVLGCRHDGQGQADLSLWWSPEDLKRNGSFIIIIIFFFFFFVNIFSETDLGLFSNLFWRFKMGAF
ncbi:hypothetical protein SDJN03_20730, partial [Cucurbita argyrosperma subsp. sororia]